MQDVQVDVWSTEIEELFLRIGHRFGRVDLRRRMRAYVRGLLGPVGRKNSWQLAEHAGHATPHGLQNLLNRARWNPDDVRDDLQEYVAERLGGPDGVLIVDDTGFLKKGTVSAGVQRQYSGPAGRTENCQIGVFAAYASSRGRALVDRELYLPKSWTGDRDLEMARLTMRGLTRSRRVGGRLARTCRLMVPARSMTVSAMTPA
ncbi:transposase, partial [Streptomyces sp. b94]|uniref:IS701 family transposase n=1 Tax=Streptomyces sp. b94 TaxID=1827634 RepID=UPI001FFC3B54